MIENIKEDGTPAVELKPCIVVYAISESSKIPYIVRDVEEANHIISKLYLGGYQVFALDYEVPINFNGWYFPKPMKALEFSIN